jgi:sugar-specific transcriptional regulator TrmB
MDALLPLGLTRYESQVYTALLEHGRSSAKEISLHANLPPTAVYPNLKSLVSKRLVQKYNGITMEFEAVPPRIGMDAYIKRRTASLEADASLLIPQLESLINTKEPFPKKQAIVLSSGSEASIAITQSFMARAKRSLYILGWRFRSRMRKIHATDFAVVRRHADIRIIVTGNDIRNREMIIAFRKQGIPLRYYPLDNFSVASMDGKEAKITLKNENLGEKFNIHILDEDLASFLEQYFLSLWKKSQPIAPVLKKQASMKASRSQ